MSKWFWFLPYKKVNVKGMYGIDEEVFFYEERDHSLLGGQSGVSDKMRDSIDDNVLMTHGNRLLNTRFSFYWGTIMIIV